MGQIFYFALVRRRVRHDALRVRLRSHVRSAIKTASWRAFAAVDTFGLVWLFSGHDTTHAIAAAGAVVGVEAITKSFLYFAHERLWEAPALISGPELLASDEKGALTITRRRKR
jgi:uncharacterized membrane protein